MLWIGFVDMFQLGIVIAVLIGMSWEPALVELAPWFLVVFAALGGSEEKLLGFFEAGGAALCVALLFTGGGGLVVAILVFLAFGQIAELIHLAGPGFLNGLLQAAGTVFRIRQRLRGRPSQSWEGQEQE